MSQAQQKTGASSGKSVSIRTPVFRISYPNLFKPRGFEGQEEKYSCDMLFEPGTDLGEMKKAIVQAMTEKFGPREKWPKGWRHPLKDGKEKSDKAGYGEGVMFATAKSAHKPTLVNGRREPIVDEKEIYGGCYCIAYISVYAYDTKGNRGVTFGLNGVQKVRDGQSFGAERDPTKMFEIVKDEGSSGVGVEEDLIGADDLGI